MQVSYYGKVYDLLPERRDVAWPDFFTRWYEADSDADKEQIPLFSCDLFKDGRGREKGRTRDNVEMVSGLLLDYDDDHGVAIEQAESCWADYEYFLHTTYSHQVPGVWQDAFRMVLPFPEPVTVAEYEAFLKGWALPFAAGRNAKFKPLPVGHAGYFLPTRRPSTASEYNRHNSGMMLDPRVLAPTSTSASPTPTGTLLHMTRPAPPIVLPAEPTPAPANIFRGMEKAHEVADLGQIEAHCSFLQHGRANAQTISEPEWRSWLSVVARCHNGREQAHEISSAYKGYRFAETDTKIDRLLSEAGPHSCAHIEQNFAGCASCPLKGKISGPLYISKVLEKSSAQSTEDVVAAAERLKRKLNHEEAIENAQRALSLAQTKEAEAKIALSLRRKLARSAPKTGAIDGEDPEVIAAMVAEREAKKAVSDAQKALVSAQKAAKQREALENPDPDVLDSLALDPFGRPDKSYRNLETVFRRDPAFSEGFAFDVFHQKVRYEGHFLDKNAQTAIRIAVNRNYGFEPSGEAVHDVAGLVGAARQTHPVKEYLRAQAWDGTERLNDLMRRGFGCLPSETQSEQYLADVGRKLCISLVARVMDPKAKNEVVVIAQGKQGKGKSTAFAALCPNKEWHSDSHLKLSDKDAYMALQGKWIYEIAELSSFKKSEQDAIKAFISSLCDNFRPPYSQFTVQQYRNTVFVASTNDDQFLDDPTGDRRWAPVTSGNIDLTWIRGNVNQLWAEAVVRYDSGEKWWYEGEEEARRSRACKPFKVEDAWTDVILHKLFEGANDGFYTVDRILTRWLNVPVERINKMEKNRLTRVMMQLGLPYVRLQQMKVALDQGYTFSPRGYWINEEARKLLRDDYAPNVIPFREPSRHDEVF
jgi:hypothetical protein